MSEDVFSPERVFRLLEQEGAEYVLIGGLAANALGVPLNTNDVDLCYNASPANRSCLVRALAPLNPRLRAGRLTDDEARALPFPWDARTLRDSPNLTLQTDAGALDLLFEVPGVGTYAAVYAAAIGVDLYGVRVAVLDLPALIASKRAAGRAKDLFALPHIEMALRMRAAMSPPQESPSPGGESHDEPSE